MKQLSFILMTFLSFLWGCKSAPNTAEEHLLSATDFAKEIKTHAPLLVLDVRQAEEYAGGHIETAINLDVLDSSGFAKGVQSLDKSKTCYLYCRSGRRSQTAAEMLRSEGFKVKELKGGIEAWMQAKLPLVK